MAKIMKNLSKGREASIHKLSNQHSDGGRGANVQLAKRSHVPVKGSHPADVGGCKTYKKFGIGDCP